MTTKPHRSTYRRAKGYVNVLPVEKEETWFTLWWNTNKMTYPESTTLAGKKYNIEIKERELTDEEKEVQNIRESLFVVNEFARDYFQNILYNHADGKAIGMTYFRQRGIRDDIVRKIPIRLQHHGTRCSGTKKPSQKDIKKKSSW